MRVYKPQFVGMALGTRRWSIQWLKESQIGSSTSWLADGVACLDDKNRTSHLDRLKAQIDAGTYHVDSYALASKMLQTSPGNILETDSRKTQATSVFSCITVLHHF